MRLHNFRRTLAAFALFLLLSPTLALDGNSPLACTIQPFAVAVQGASPQESRMASHKRLSRWSERVLTQLDQSKCNEPNPHLRDDIHIAYLTVLYAAREDVSCCTPHMRATLDTLGLHPDKVWPAIVARRKAQCGSLYSAFYDENDLWRGGDLDSLMLPPKKAAEREGGGIAANKAA
jgi:hypothetical protein